MLKGAFESLGRFRFNWKPGRNDGKARRREWTKRKRAEEAALGITRGGRKETFLTFELRHGPWY